MTPSARLSLSLSPDTRQSHAPLNAVAPHVLAVDDDASVREMISDYLGDNEVRVTTLASGREIGTVMSRQVVDLLILDLRMPGEDGLQIARKLREESDVPIIMFTGRNDEVDRVIALELGADDYITKPCSPRELLARVRAVLRRTRSASPQARPSGVRAYRFDGWELNLNTRRLTAGDGRLMPLRNSEFNLLAALLGSAQRVLTRSQLLDLSRLHNDEVFDRSIDVQVMRLRRRIESDPARPRYIRTERGVGYEFTLPVQVVS